MNIGIDAKRAFKNFSGLGNYSRSLIEGVSKFYPKNNYYLYTPEYNNEGEWLNFSKADNTHIIKPTGIYKSLPSSFWRSYGIANNVKRDNIDLFHGLSGELPVNKLSVPTVVTLHDVICVRYPQFFKPLDRKIYTKKFTQACKDADKIIAISKQTADDIIHYLNADPSKIEIVLQGCDKAFHTQPTTEEIAAAKVKYNLPDKFIINVGTIETRKNLVTVIKALKEIPKEVQLIALGRATPYMNEVNAAIKEMGVEERVRVIHNATFRDFPAIYKQALALTYVSVFEGFGIPVLEGITVGTPVITSNISSMPEAGGDSALYVDPNNQHQIAAHINTLINNPAAAAEIIEKGYKYAAKFSEQKVTDNIYNVYNQLLKY